MRKVAAVISLIWVLGLATAAVRNPAPIQPIRGPVYLQDLVGEWHKSQVSTIDFVNRSTGVHAGPSEESLNVRFEADGTFKLGWLLQSTLSNCSSRVLGDQRGEFTLADSTIDLEVTSNTLIRTDSCHPEGNSETHPGLGRSSYHLQLGRMKHGVVLIMRGPTGKEEVYARDGRTTS
jgi:hypothetical protein